MPSRLGDARTHEEPPFSVFDAISWPTSRYGHLALGANWQTPFAECSIESHIVCDASWWELDPELPSSPWWLGGGDHWQAVGFRIVRPLDEGPAEQWTKYWEPDSEELQRDVSDSLASGRGVQGRPLPRKQLRDAPR